MTETVTNSTAHSSEIDAYCSSSRTCEATEKYANVTTPVVAIPIERIRAPRPYAEAPARRADPSSCSYRVSPARRATRSSCSYRVSPARRATRLPNRDEQHRPRERRARLDDLAVSREQRLEA